MPASLTYETIISEIKEKLNNSLEQTQLTTVSEFLDLLRKKDRLDELQIIHDHVVKNPRQLKPSICRRLFCQVTDGQRLPEGGGVLFFSSYGKWYQVNSKQENTIFTDNLEEASSFDRALLSFTYFCQMAVIFGAVLTAIGVLMLAVGILALLLAAISLLITLMCCSNPITAALFLMILPVDVVFKGILVGICILATPLSIPLLGVGLLTEALFLPMAAINIFTNMIWYGFNSQFVYAEETNYPDEYSKTYVSIYSEPCNIGWYSQVHRFLFGTNSELDYPQLEKVLGGSAKNDAQLTHRALEIVDSYLKSETEAKPTNNFI